MQHKWWATAFLPYRASPDMTGPLSLSLSLPLSLFVSLSLSITPFLLPSPLSLWFRER